MIEIKKDYPLEGEVRIEMKGSQGGIILSLSIDDEGFPVVDAHFPDGRGQHFTVNADDQDRVRSVPFNKDLCVTLGD